MTEVFDTSFCYIYIMSFMFLFYQFFIKNDIEILNRGSIEIRSNFKFCYFIVILFVLIYEIYHYLFIKNYSEKKNSRYVFEDLYSFPLNFKTLLKGTVTILSLFVFYLLFGFLGTLFLTFFFT